VYVRGKWKSLVSDQINILGQVDVHTGTGTELESQLKLSVSTLNSIMKNNEVVETGYIQHGPFSKQQKSLKHLLQEKLEPVLAARFKQAHESNASTDGPQLNEKAFHMAIHQRIANFFSFQRVDQQI
jgi:hypothetical protein